MRNRKNEYHYTHSTWEQLAWEMDNDFDRYPLPICMDPYEEGKALWRRERKVKEIARRWYNRFGKVGQAG